MRSWRDKRIVCRFAISAHCHDACSDCCIFARIYRIEGGKGGVGVWIGVRKRAESGSVKGMSVV